MFKNLFNIIKECFQESPKVSGRYFKEVGITLFDDEKKDYSEYKNLAKNTMNEKILAVLAESYNDSIRCSVASNSYSNMETLTKLLRDKCWCVRDYLASNIKITSEMLDVLAYDECLHVRRSVAENPNTSIKTLEKLCQDIIPHIVTEAKENLASKQILYYI